MKGILAVLLFLSITLVMFSRTLALSPERLGAELTRAGASAVARFR